MDFLSNHGDTIALLIALAGVTWQAATRINALQSSITVLETKLESVQRELHESKESASRNFEKIYDLIRNGSK